MGSVFYCICFFGLNQLIATILNNHDLVLAYLFTYQCIHEKLNHFAPLLRALRLKTKNKKNPKTNKETEKARTRLCYRVECEAGKPATCQRADCGLSHTVYLLVRPNKLPLVTVCAAWAWFISGHWKTYFVDASKARCSLRSSAIWGRKKNGFDAFLRGQLMNCQCLVVAGRLGAADRRLGCSCLVSERHQPSCQHSVLF